jgi:hypothetical protein
MFIGRLQREIAYGGGEGRDGKWESGGVSRDSGRGTILAESIDYVRRGQRLSWKARSDEERRSRSGCVNSRWEGGVAGWREGGRAERGAGADRT